jgi:hypothetical protein
MVKLTRLPALTHLATQLRTADFPLAENWHAVEELFTSWAAQPELRDELRGHLRRLQPADADAIRAGSRETTTHFAWCLLNSPRDEFSFWLHEYKPQQDWRHGYADSVHNHRYHFCTTILRGSYVHERYDALVDPRTELITSANLLKRNTCSAGASGALTADQFHRIPEASGDTMTFLVKSRPVTDSSVSYDPTTGISHRHVPMEVRLEELADLI